MESLTKKFNFKAILHWSMWIGMAGMTLMLLGSFPSPTPGDGLLGLPMHMLQGAVQLFSTGFDTLSTIAGNALAGNFMPNHAADMWNAAWSGSHGAAEMAGMVGHIHSAAMTNQWQWFGGLSQMAQGNMIADAAYFGMPLDQYVADWCAKNGLTFTP